jgi:hypothetical protein
MLVVYKHKRVTSNGGCKSMKMLKIRHWILNINGIYIVHLRYLKLKLKEIES